MGKSAFRLAAAIGFAIAISRVSGTEVQAGPDTNPLDTWLAAHPSIASVMIWEFPPPRSLRIPPRRFIVWAAPKLPPDLGLLIPLGDNVFPDRFFRGTFEPAGLTDSTRLGGFDAAKLVGDFPVSQVPGNLPEFLPGGIKTSEYGAEIRAWSKWPEWAKQQLRDRFTAYDQWAQAACGLYADYAASGFTVKPEGFDEAFSTVVDLDPMPVFDPPENIQPDDPLIDGTPWAMVSSADAFALYVRHVAAQLAIEINACVPWSALEYPSSDRTPLFDGRTMFRYVTKGASEWGEMSVTGHVVLAGLTPAPPLIVLGFLGQNGLIGSDRLDTVGRLFEWERSNLRHVIGGTPAVPVGAGVGYWGYNGRAPVSRMINGTVMAAPLEQSSGFMFFDPEVRHWVGGCGGASPFNAEVLRTINIAAHRTSYGHFQNRFALGGGVHKGIGHGDDPYALASAPEIPAIEILIDDATFHDWFVNESDPIERLKKVGRRTADLYLQYLPQVLLGKHCQDLAAGTDHVHSAVYNYAFASSYTVDEAEAAGLWTGLDAKLAEIGGCAALGF